MLLFNQDLKREALRKLASQRMPRPEWAVVELRVNQNSAARDQFYG